MKIAPKYNKSEIMKEAHRLYKSNNRFGWSFGKSLLVAWNNAKMHIKNAEVEAKNKIIRAGWKTQAEAKRKAEIEKKNNHIITSGMDLHTYTMANYYTRYGYKGD